MPMFAVDLSEQVILVLWLSTVPTEHSVAPYIRQLGGLERSRPISYAPPMLSCVPDRAMSGIAILRSNTGGGYNILTRTTRLAQSLGNVPLIRN